MSIYSHALTKISDYSLFELNQRMYRLGTVGNSREAVRLELKIRGYNPDTLPVFRHPTIIEDRIQASLKRQGLVDPLQGQIPYL